MPADEQMEVLRAIAYELRLIRKALEAQITDPDARRKYLESVEKVPEHKAYRDKT